MSVRKRKIVLRPVNFLGALIVAATVSGSVYLHTIGTSNEDYVYSINFSRGSIMDARETTKVDEIVDLLKSNDSYTATVVGHSGTIGDPEPNQVLSVERAEVFARLLKSEGVTNEIITKGVGGEQPLKQQNTETLRDWQARLSRVTVHVESPL